MGFPNAQGRVPSGGFKIEGYPAGAHGETAITSRGGDSYDVHRRVYGHEWELWKRELAGK